MNDYSADEADFRRPTPAPGRKRQAELLPLAPQELRQGTMLGKYRVLATLGSGGMGIVYAAEDTWLKRQVAVKVLSTVASASRDAVQRFVREARAAASLHHPNVVAVFDIGQEGEQLFIVMEHVPGGSLKTRLEHGPLPWIEATRVTVDACRGLVAAHARGLIHRDIKPSNLLLAADGAVKLADFGLARGRKLVGTALTQPGEVLGTPTYMSPEQARGEKVDASSDIYALGGTYFALLTGRPPFQATTPVGILFAHCSYPVPDPSTRVPGLPPACSRIIQRAMAKDPAGRHASAAAMLQELEALLAEGSAVLAAAAHPASAIQTVQSLAGKQVQLETGTDPSGVRVELFRIPGQGTDEASAYRPAARPWWLLALLGVLGLLLVGGLLYWLTVPASEEPPKTMPRATPLPPRLTLLHSWKTEAAIGDLAWSARADLLAVGNLGGPRSLFLWSTPQRRQLWSQPMEDAVVGVAFTADQQQLLVALKRGDLQWWNCASGRRDKQVSVNAAGSLRSLRRCPTAPVVALGVRARDSKSTWVMLWDYEAQRDLGVWRNEVDEVHTLSWTADGKMLAVAGENGSLRLWTWQTLKKVAFKGGILKVRAVACAPVGTLVAVGGEPVVRGRPGKSCSIEIYDHSSNRRVGSVEELTSPVTALAFFPDGQRFVAGCEDGTLVIGRHGRTAPLLTQLQDGTGRVRSLAIAPDGRTLACGTNDGVVHFWDVSRVE